MVDEESLHRWFVSQVLPFERALSRYITRNCRDANDVHDIRQDVYEKALDGAKASLPTNTRAYLYTIARNHLITRAKRAQIVSFDLVADLETVAKADDWFAAEQGLDARDQLRRAQMGIERLSPRCREVVQLRKIEGLSTADAAERLNVSRATVEQQLKMGMKALADFMLGGSGKIDWGHYVRRRERRGE